MTQKEHHIPPWSFKGSKNAELQNEVHIQKGKITFSVIFKILIITELLLSNAIENSCF